MANAEPTVDSKQHLADRFCIREMLEQYFHGVDSKSRQEVLSCFMENAEAEYHCDTPERKAVYGAASICEDIFASCSRFTSSTHCIANSSIEVVDNLAHTDTFAIAHVLIGDNMLVRG